jgi:hypothetical protein
MTTTNALEKNKALVHKFFHAYQSGAFDQIVAHTCLFRSTLQPETAVFSQAAAQWRAAFANGRFQLNTLIAEETRSPPIGTLPAHIKAVGPKPPHLGKPFL